MKEMSIGEVAKQADLETSTLRYYESIGILPPAKRVSGQRRYTAKALELLAIIQVAKEAGFTLFEVHTLLSGFSEEEPPSPRWKELARRKLPEIEALILRAQNMKQLLLEGLECDCLSLNECAVLVRRRDDAEGRRPQAEPSISM